MDVTYINPFLSGVYSVFDTMLGIKVKRGHIAIASETASPETLVALIGLSGPARGTVALHLPKATALNLINNWLTMELADIDQTVSDGIAELVNMIAGQAKVTFSEEVKTPIDLGLPTVVHGDSYKVQYPSKTTWLEIPFNCDLGAFSLRVTFQLNGKAGGHKQ
jgi:chemotaxis protein CheX